MNVSTSTAGVRRRGKKSLQEEEENAALLRLGPEFDITQYNHDGESVPLIALNLSEARLLIRTALKQRKKLMNSNGEFKEDADYINAQNKDNDEEENSGNDNGGNESDDNDLGPDDDNDEIAKAAIAVGANEVLKKTLDYLSVFARFRDEQTCTAVEQVLKTPENSNLHPFEIAQLGTLACDDSDEAKTLIPSLANKKTDDELQTILNQLSRLETPY